MNNTAGMIPIAILEDNRGKGNDKNSRASLDYCEKLGQKSDMIGGGAISAFSTIEHSTKLSSFVISS